MPITWNPSRRKSRARWASAAPSPIASTPFGGIFVRPDPSGSLRRGPGQVLIGISSPSDPTVVVPEWSGSLRPIALSSPSPQRFRVWMPRGFGLVAYTPSPAGDTDPDVATLILFAQGVLPPSMLLSDPDAASLVLWASGAAPASMALTDPDSASLLP